ncbi:FadR family transcriptional regulator [Tsukamurella tyrosinosolvens]|uniref:FadR/GntR family transcriptional regulator n=1 Tax=Tsukamurella tyrosinosolvens TaxID=57704 RepID=UPI0007990ED5|nr:FCD domain-containing protein [Tsukamurella tyrosinosolvens]KXP07580.1 GntR family transcriptional regulator [Tsukamurella tyrosinosolvens]KZL98783.1 GntR family transcriptional regulator [Tsukamurella tyrosinosolvens]MCA4995006.1 FadR family transcriptional regulator [Tsukamurella tyrosinosolvens]
MNQTTGSLSERIADGIVEIVRTEELQPGDALASSRQLAEHFGVTTPTVREALRRLEAIDVVRFRHGSGTYVGDGVRRRVIGNPHAPRGDLRAALELADARLALEPSIAALAARHRSDADLARLAAATDNALRPPAGVASPDLHFHVVLAQASGNRLLGETIESLLESRRLDQVEIRHQYADRPRDHAEHLGLVDAVSDRDEQRAESLARDHLQHIRDAVAAALAAQEAGR